MDNIGDFIYIIILLVFIVGNAIMAGIKKKQQQNRKGPPPESTGRPVSDQFDDVFGELFGREERKTAPQPKPAKKPTTKVSEPSESASEFVRAMNERAERARMEAAKGIERKPDMQLEYLGSEHRVEFEMDIKQAMIHQVILEPRYENPFEK